MQVQVPTDLVTSLLDENADGEIHTFIQTGPCLIGADWPAEEVRARVENARVCIAGETARGMGHGIAIIFQDNTRERVVFLKTKDGVNWLEVEAQVASHAQPQQVQ